ncbi:conserved hypothetical protein [Verrucomicrobia bacterium]|nr:conserved hypothetical protein [Verrucomicrobiota bacterium]
MKKKRKLAIVLQSGQAQWDDGRGGIAKSRLAPRSILLVLVGTCSRLLAGEDEPRRPFAQWADVPAQGQLIAGVFYEQSEAYHLWEGNERLSVNYRTGGENYGIDVRQGYFTLDYGLTEKWAADVNFGGTTVGWRAFNPDGSIGQATGSSDTTFGVRYQIFNEAQPGACSWLPTLTFRAGAIVPGSFDRHVAFAPGNHGVAVEPSLLLRKHVGWPGFGVWTDVLYRWEHTLGNDQYIAAVGLFQQIKNWELDIAYRHMQAISGEDIVVGPPAGGGAYNGITYPTDVREISDSIDAGFSYTTSKRHIRYAFHARKTFDGSNTDSPLWLGAYLDFPFDTPWRKNSK